MSKVPFFRMRAALVAASVVCVVAACAKAYAPPGGTQDRTPPRLVSTTPDALAVQPSFTGPIVFTFDETLAERGVTAATVVVSPEPPGGVEVERHGNRIEISTEGGWVRDQIYRVIIRPGIGDRFGNRRTDAIEIVFSTGPPIQNTAIAGLVTDRLTGRPAEQAAIEAVRRADSAVYTASADTAGFFALRSIPAGVYDMRAYADMNRNRRRDPSEAVSAIQQVNLSTTDTVPAQLVLLPADTTGPNLGSAEPIDSMNVTLVFDDYIDPVSGLTNAVVQVVRESDSAPVPGPATVVLQSTYRRLLQEAAAARNAARDTAADPAAAQAGRAPVQAARDTVPLPQREVVVTLSSSLAPGVEYRVTISGVHNVNGLVGGGSDDFDAPAAASPPAARPDTVSAPPDTTAGTPPRRRDR